MRQLMYAVIVISLSGCASSKMSTDTHDHKNSQTKIAPKAIHKIAIAPGSGVMGDAIGVELFNAGVPVLDANEVSKIIGRLGLQEFEISTPKAESFLRSKGIDAVLIVKAVAGSDGTPESASIRITSTTDGRTITGITWQNGWGGQRGSVADRTMRKNLSDAAREMSKAIMKRIYVEK